MFQKALKEVVEYTLPVVVSSHRKNGRTESSIATFVVLNDEGWVLTACHVIKGVAKLERSRSYRSKVSEIKGDESLSRKEQKEKIKTLGSPPKNEVIEFSIWWGKDEWSVDSFLLDETADLAVGKISGFKADQIPNYPVFKNPSVNFHPGESLCKLGFPFYTIVPEFKKDEGFFFPEGTLPLPLFPLEGIFTRVVFPKGIGTGKVRFVETSSPGLKGQSGGPTFDVKGRIWALQSRTTHYPLGFSPVPPGGRNGEHQFLNVGMGTHVETIIKFLEKHGINHEVSED